MSYTVSSTDVLRSVFSQHPAQVIIATAAFLPQVLELMDTSEIRPLNYTVVVVGEVGAQLKARVPNNVQIVLFSELEKKGHHADKVVGTMPRTLPGLLLMLEKHCFSSRSCRHFHNIISKGHVRQRCRNSFHP
jgi:hypothetical protein